MFDEFALETVEVSSGSIRVRNGGSGPPIVLLHGHPRTHTTWWKVAPLLADTHTVICPDLPGYGKSTVRRADAAHSSFSKREMASAIVELMSRLGHERYVVVGHDRGSYVAFRLALDHPSVVDRLILLDCVPIGEALARADWRFAAKWWHWFFLGQTGKPAENLINRDPLGWYGADPETMGQANFEDFAEAVSNPETVHAMCEDYRAGLTVDRTHDEADMASGARISCPLQVLWSTEDDLWDLYGDPAKIWRNWATSLEVGSVNSGHHVAELASNELAQRILNFVQRT